MFAIYGGKQEFTQWDLDQLVTNPCMNEGDEVVFKALGKTYETTAFVMNGETVADVPNFLLQKPCEITVDLRWGLDVNLECRTVFNVAKRDKPADYCCDYNIKYRPEKNSGGVSSWNDLTDKPFGEETGMVEVLPETTVTGEAGYELIIPNIIDVTVGATYIVTHNGVDYEQVGQAIDVDGISAVGFGDLTNFGGTGNGEPFTMIIFPADIAPQMGVGGMLVNADGSTSATISITTEGTVITPIEGKYLPKGTPWIEEGEMVEIVNINSPFGTPKEPLVVGEVYKCTINSLSGETFEFEGEAKDGAGFAPDWYGNLAMKVYIGDKNGACVAWPGEGYDACAVDDRSERAMSFSVYKDNTVIKKLDKRCLPDDATSFTLVSPNGTKYAVTVSDSGTLSATKA